MEDKVKNYILPEVKYGIEDTVSYSEYSTYMKCPHHWYLSYVKKLDPRLPSIYTIFGTSIHETIQHYLQLIYSNSDELDSFEIIEYFNDRFRFNYSKEFDRTKEHFSDAVEMKEFFEDGSAILNYIKLNYKNYFKTKKVKLLGVEIPLLYKINKSLYYKGFIDFVIYDEEEDKVVIFDIKTSTRGYTDKDKKDENKIAQVLLYKEFFAKQYGFEIDKIEVEYFVVKRKLYESPNYIIPRIQTFSPASGKIKRKKTMDSFNKFLNECYTNNTEVTHPKHPSKTNCKYCPYSSKPDLCDKNGKG